MLHTYLFFLLFIISFEEAIAVLFATFQKSTILLGCEFGVAANTYSPFSNKKNRRKDPMTVKEGTSKDIKFNAFKWEF